MVCVFERSRSGVWTSLKYFNIFFSFQDKNEQCHWVSDKWLLFDDLKVMPLSSKIILQTDFKITDPF